MTNLKQEDAVKALIQLVNVVYLINDGYHNKELCDLFGVMIALVNELNDANTVKFRIWLKKKLEEKDSE